MSNAPSPVASDRSAILDTVDALFPPDAIVELRALFLKGKKRTDSGYFDGAHREALAEHAARLNTAGAAVYVPLNPINPQLLARYCNRMQDYADKTTSDAEVTARRWLLLDFDPARPAGTSATDAQLSEAREVSDACLAELQLRGWPAPIVAESGNGMHLLYHLDLPNDAESRDLVKGALSGLATRFDTRRITLDQSVFNAGRITKLYGTVANKGDPTPATPWRLSRLLFVPVHESVVSVEQLREWVPVTAHPAPRVHIPGAGFTVARSTFDLDAFLSRLGIPFAYDVHEGADRYKLAHCPFNPEHGKGEAAIFRHADGGLGFKCQHNSCADRHWQDVRNLVDPGRTRVASATAAPEAPQGAQAGSIHVVSGDRRANAYSASWPQPEPLPAGLVPVDPFDMALLPDRLRPWIEDVCERLQCPPDFVAVPAVVSAGSLIGRKVAIRPQARTDWTTYPNVWGALIGRPGVMKSPAVSEALRPLRRIEARALADYKASAAEHEALAELSKLKRDAARKKVCETLSNGGAVTPDELRIDTLEAPTLKRYTANDSSVEALGELMRQNPNGLLIERDELASLLSHLSREDNATARGFYLTGADATSGYTFDRIGRGLNLHVPAVCLSVVGTTQPGRIASFLRSAISGGNGDDGMMQRFGLIVWPDHGAEWRNVDRWPDSAARTNAADVFDRLAALAPDSIGAEIEDDGAYLRFSDEALEAFTAWRTALETRLRSGDLHPALESHLAKYRKTIPSLALIFHLADGGSGPVSVTATLRALAWSDYLETHARRCYGASQTPETDTARRILERIRRRDVRDGFRARDITQRDWSGLTDRKAVADALDLLGDHGWIAEERPPAGAPGRPSSIYRINPRGIAR